MYILHLYIYNNNNNYQLQEMLGNMNNYSDDSFERKISALKTIISRSVFYILNENKTKNSSV